MGLMCNIQKRYASGRMVSGQIIGVKYIQACNMIWYISLISGKNTENVDNKSPMPSAKADSINIEIGTKSVAHVIDFLVTRVISISGIMDKERLTIPVRTEEIANEV